MADEDKEKKSLKETKPNDAGYSETKAPVSSGDSSALDGMDDLPPIAPPGAKN